MTTSTPNTQRNLWSFFLLAYAFSWIFWIPEALAANGFSLPSGLKDFLASPFNLAAFGPLLAALVLTLVNDGWKGVGTLLKRGLDARFKKTWLLAILFLPLLIFAGAILLSIRLGATPLDLSVLSNPPYFTVAFVVILLTAGPLQEEFGWRGYALPRLQTRFNALTSGLILGVFWWLWHLPLVFISGKFMTDSLPLFFLLLIEIALMSVLFVWIYNNTGGSLLASMLFHAAMNWSIWIVLPSMKVNATIVGITVLLLAIAVSIVVYVWGPKRLSHAENK